MQTSRKFPNPHSPDDLLFCCIEAAQQGDSAPPPSTPFRLRRRRIAILIYVEFK
jgi:hypothetical protein